jgi:threonine/homoserine/homoserine lactone efflux protein
MILFLCKAIVISLSGVMAPGPVTAATVAAGTRQRHAGALVALGHGVVEFPLMALIILGIGWIFSIEGVKIGIGLLGGAFLAWMGAGMLLALRRPDQAAGASPRRHPLVTGIVLTGGNPYFLLWWATIGLALATEAATLGVWAFALFAVIHWLCDLVWLEALSLATFKGSRLLGGRSRSIILAVCAAAMLVFAVLFLYDAGGRLLRAWVG